MKTILTGSSYIAFSLARLVTVIADLNRLEFLISSGHQCLDQGQTGQLCGAVTTDRAVFCTKITGYFFATKGAKQWRKTVTTSLLTRIVA